MKKIFLAILFITQFLTASTKPKLLIYCGITMVKPIKEMSKIIEKKYNCTIDIIQGGSRGLYDSLKYAKVGDIYLPGSESYRKEYLKDGYLKDAVFIGYNKAAIFVQKHNPKNIKNLDSFMRKDVAITLCDPKSGSIGRMTKNIILSYKDQKFYKKLYDKAVMIGTDSRNLNVMLINKIVDATINWRATAFWDENKQYIDIVEIDDKYAPKKRLVLNLLSFSKYPKIAKAFMQFAASKEGKNIMKKYGFLW